MYYWEVHPRQIKISRNDTTVRIPLSIRGNPSGTPIYETTNQLIADVSPEGEVICGLMEGAAMIMIYDSAAKTSVRHVQVEVLAPAADLEVVA